MALDIYSDHRIPFMIGTWARAHKFNTTAVSLSRTVTAIREKEAAIKRAEHDLAALEQTLAAHIANAEDKMGALNGI